MEMVHVITIEEAKKILELFDFSKFESMNLTFTSFQRAQLHGTYYISTHSEHRVVSHNPLINDLDIKFNKLDCELTIIEVYYKDESKHFILDLAKHSITFYGFDAAPITKGQIRDKIGYYFREINLH